MTQEQKARVEELTEFVSTATVNNRETVFYTDADGDTVEAYVESITDDGYIIIDTGFDTRYRVSPEELL